MKKIYKYLIDNEDKYIYNIKLSLPANTKLLSCISEPSSLTRRPMQTYIPSKIAIYAEVEVAAAIEIDEFIDIRVIGTGVAIPDDNHLYSYLGTVRLDSSVWHVYYKRGE
jgi:hypothetical protein